jgi:hypothetical protein
VTADPERTALDVHIDAADRAGHSPDVIDLDWTASGYRRTRQFAARIADELDVRALTQSFAIGMLAAAAAPDDLDATDEQIGRLARGIVQALVDLRLVAP